MNRANREIGDPRNGGLRLGVAARRGFARAWFYLLSFHHVTVYTVRFTTMLSY
jgi:hypothetical protein